MYPIYNLTLDDLDEDKGMYLISLVSESAMEVQAVKLSVDAEQVLVCLKATDEYKQHLTSAVIIPDKLIVRHNDIVGTHYIKFSASEVEKIRDRFFQKTGNLSLSNKNHNAADTVDAQLIESWIIEDASMDKAVALGFQGLPKGTLMATYKVKDKGFWDSEVMTGNVTGFSLEGQFKSVKLALSEPEATDFDKLIAFVESLADDK